MDAAAYRAQFYTHACCAFLRCRCIPRFCLVYLPPGLPACLPAAYRVFYLPAVLRFTAALPAPDSCYLPAYWFAAVRITDSSPPFWFLPPAPPALPTAVHIRSVLRLVPTTPSAVHCLHLPVRSVTPQFCHLTCHVYRHRLLPLVLCHLGSTPTTVRFSSSAGSTCCCLPTALQFLAPACYRFYTAVPGSVLVLPFYHLRFVLPGFLPAVLPASAVAYLLPPPAVWILPPYLRCALPPFCATWFVSA